MKRIVIATVVLAALLSIYIVHADTDVDGRIVYIREVDGQSLAVDYQTGQATTIYGGRCSKFSPELRSVALFDVVDPQVIDIIDLTDGAVVSQIPWDEAWGEYMVGAPCRSSGWDDSNHLTIVYENLGLQTQIHLSDGSIIINSAVLPPSLSFVHPRSMLPPVFSPENDYVAYRRCDDEECRDSSFVIYDISEDEVVTDIDPDVSDLLITRSLDPDRSLSWSHDSRYLAYAAVDRNIAIYDLVGQNYVDLAFVPESVSLLNRGSGGMKWSPTSGAIAIPVQATLRMGYPFDMGIAIVDIQNRTFRIVEAARENMPFGGDSFQWLPSGEGFLLANDQGDLHLLDLTDETLTLVDDHVLSILVWYAPSS